MTCDGSPESSPDGGKVSENSFGLYVGFPRVATDSATKIEHRTAYIIYLLN